MPEHRIICKDKSVKWALSRGKIIKRDKNGKLLMLNADVAMYESKRNGKNQAKVFDVNVPSQPIKGFKLVNSLIRSQIKVKMRGSL